MCFAAPSSLVSLDKLGRSVGTETDVNSSFCSEEKKNVIEICTAEQMNEASSFSNGFASTSQEHFQFWVIERLGSANKMRTSVKMTIQNVANKSTTHVQYTPSESDGRHSESQVVSDRQTEKNLQVTNITNCILPL